MARLAKVSGPDSKSGEGCPCTDSALNSCVKNQPLFRETTGGDEQGVVTIDRKGIITGFNLRAERMFNLSSSEAFGRPYFDIIIKDKLPHSWLLMTLETGIEVQDQRINYLISGEMTPLLLNTVLLRNHNYDPVGGMGVFSFDCPNRAKRPERLNPDELTERLAAVGELAAYLAHEIRNPLTSLKGFLQLVQLRKPDLKSAPEYDEYLGIMLGEVDRIYDLVREFLTMAKPGGGNYRHIHLKPILEELFVLVGQQAMAQRTQLLLDCPPDIPKIYLDPNQIKQVFLNIIQNGIQAAKDRGTLSVKVSHQPANKTVSIFFTDNGPGIPDNHLARIFHPFFTTKEDGTGLGLAISYRIIKNHGGDIDVKSQPGRGTTFMVTLSVEGPLGNRS